MAFNPLEETGMPVADQFRNWRELNIDPFDTQEVHPYTRTRVILMNGIEVESIMFSHQFARHTDHVELTQALARNRRVDAQQQKLVNGLNPGDQSPLETTIGYEQVAVDLTAWLARHEPDPDLKQALDFALLEDFDHLYRYANLYEMMGGRHAEELTGELTEIMPGRPTEKHHRHPDDMVKGHFDTHTVDPLSRLHVMTIVAAEQQTMNYYMNHNAEQMEPIARALYNEIAQVEEEHVSHYESLIDPLDSWLSRWVFHEYNEVYLYWSMMQNEVDPRIKNVWETHCNMEIGQLRVAAEWLERLEGRDAAEILPPEMPDTPVTFEPNKEYVRSILSDQLLLRTDRLHYVQESELADDHRFFEYQETVNGDHIPSEEVVRMAREKLGQEYRNQTAGEHPIADLREGAESRG